MAQTKKALANNAKRVELAQQEFEKYKIYIAKQIHESCKISYVSEQYIQEVWRKEFAYTSEREMFLIRKTRHFLRLFPIDDRDYQSPVFLKSLVGLISDYLSIYTVKSGAGNRHDCKDVLIAALYSDNPHVNLTVDRYVKENNTQHYKWAKEKERKKAEKTKQPKTQKVEPSERPLVRCRTSTNDSYVSGPVRYRQIKERIAKYKAENALENIL